MYFRPNLILSFLALDSRISVKKKRTKISKRTKRHRAPSLHVLLKYRLGGMGVYLWLVRLVLSPIPLNIHPKKSHSAWLPSEDAKHQQQKRQWRNPRPNTIASSGIVSLFSSDAILHFSFYPFLLYFALLYISSVYFRVLLLKKTVEEKKIRSL